MVRKKKQKKKTFLNDVWKSVLIILIAIGIFCAGAILIWISTFKIPTLDSFPDRKVIESTKIYDRTGKIVLYDVYQDVRRTVVPFDQISQNIKNATLAIEDKDFYSHGGIDPRGIARAMVADVKTGSFSQGGSTITQQVVKNSLLTDTKTITRKLKEVVLAIRLEKILTKNEIFNIYLNEIPYGGSIYGVQEASRSFFGKDAKDLTITEAAYLASLPKAPTYYSPYGSHREALENRKNIVLKEELHDGMINQNQYDQAMNEAVAFITQQGRGIKAPHFVMYVRQLLEQKYGEQALEQDGLHVITTLNWSLQQKAEDIVKSYAPENEKNFNASNAAILALDPKSGQILTMVGSRDYFDKDIDGNFNAATAPNRQPGSTFKPFVYAEAFNKGYTPDTIIFDLPTQFSTTCPANLFLNNKNCYAPTDYDPIYKGPITIRDALAQSVNVVAVKTLYLTGINSVLDLVGKMGVESLKSAKQYGLSLALGAGSVSLLDITSAYGVFANEGVRQPYTSILSVTDKNGTVLEKYTPSPGERVLPRDTALKISDVLSDNVARTPEFGANSPLYFPGYDVADKTGTTNNSVDAWTIGYTPDIAVGAWAGNNDNSPMAKKIAGYIITPMWNAVMSEALKNVPNTPFPKPSDTTVSFKPVLRGKWQGGISSVTENSITDTSSFGNETLYGGVHSILQWVLPSNPQGPYPTNPASDPQYHLWEYSVRLWAQQHGYN